MSNSSVPLQQFRSNKRALALTCVLIAALGITSTNNAATAGATSQTAVVAPPIESRDPRGTDQIIVRMSDGSTPDIAELTREAGESVSLNHKMRDGGWVSKLSGRRSPAALAAIAGRISALPNVAYAEPDLKMFAAAIPNDPLFPAQWELFAPSAGLSGINTPAAWDITRGTSDVVVAVLDTGITAHADLAGQTVPGYDFITNASIANDGGGRDANPSDPGDWVTTAENALGTFPCGASNSSWHGTHVAGTIGATTDNAIGVAGVASGAKILPVRVLGKCGGSTSDIADAIRWSAGLAVTGVPTNPNPAAVLSISLGGVGACPATYQNAINDAIAVGASVVVAAGNSTADASTFAPANCAGVITVAATGATGNRSYYSNFGTSVEIAAPGGDKNVASNGTVAAAGDLTGEITSTLNSGLTTPSTDIYAYYQGTSMATPHVSGVAALVKSVQPSIAPAALTALLRSTSAPFAAGSTCTTALCGTGILNAANAVTAAAAAAGPRTLGAFSKTSPAAGATGAALAPTLTWAPSTGASTYEYCVVAGVATPCTTWISNGAATSVALSGLVANTLYSWQVRAHDAAGTATAEANVSLRYTFTTGTVAGAFAKSAPANAATGIATTRSLTWGASTGATSYEYCIDLVVNNACDATWVSTGATRSATVGPLLGSTRYEWQVRARNTIGVVVANANVAWTFTTVAPPLPGAFAKTSPSRNQTARPLALTLSWGASTSTISYQYCVDTVNNNLCDTAWVSTGTTRTAAITGLIARTGYYWQVRAIGAGGTTLANGGTWWLFTTA